MEFHETFELIKQNVPYEIENQKRKFRTQVETILDQYEFSYIKLFIRSPKILAR